MNANPSLTAAAVAAVQGASNNGTTGMMALAFADAVLTMKLSGRLRWTESKTCMALRVLTMSPKAVTAELKIIVLA